MPPNDAAPNESDADFALTQLLALIEDYYSFNPETIVPTYPYPTSLQFSQQVTRGRPCVYQLDRKVLGALNDSNSEINGHNTTTGNGKGYSDLVGDQKQKSSKDFKRKKLEGEQRWILTAPCFTWTKKSLCNLVEGEVEVAVTPDGRADSMYLLPTERHRELRGQRLENNDEGQAEESNESEVQSAGGEAKYREVDEAEQVFLQPATTRMALSSLLDKLCPPQPSSSPSSTKFKSKSPIYYLQSQNSNLSQQPLSSLLPHLPTSPPPFSLPILGDPEATNIWIGNAASVTSTHRDPYENLYLVVQGRKKFVLYAPVDEVALHSKMVRMGRWVYDEKMGEFEIVMDDEDENGGRGEGADLDASSSSQALSDGVSIELDHISSRIPWIPIDPFNEPPPSSKTYPYYKHARPLTVTVNEGEILYLPAGWFHHVTQECGQWEDEDGTLIEAPCIAVNYWFDMDYSGEKYVMREMVSRLVERVRTG